MRALGLIPKAVELNLAQSRPQHERTDCTPFRCNNIVGGTFSRPGIPRHKHTCRSRCRMAEQLLSFGRYHRCKSTIEPGPVYRIGGQLQWLCRNSESKPFELGCGLRRCFAVASPTKARVAMLKAVIANRASPFRRFQH